MKCRVALYVPHFSRTLPAASSRRSTRIAANPAPRRSSLRSFQIGSPTSDAVRPRGLAFSRALSALVRGWLELGYRDVHDPRFTPACAGRPPTRVRFMDGTEVDPRVHGVAVFSVRGVVPRVRGVAGRFGLSGRPCTGRPPRARGGCETVPRDEPWRRLMPASAGLLGDVVASSRLGLIPASAGCFGAGAPAFRERLVGHLYYRSLRELESRGAAGSGRMNERTGTAAEQGLHEGIDH